MNDWRPIETAPKDGTPLLLWARDEMDGRMPYDYAVWLGWWSTTAWHGPAWVGCENRSDTEYLEPTHWMPLPTPPTQEREK